MRGLQVTSYEEGRKQKAEGRKQNFDILRKRKATFIEECKTRKTVHTTMITTFGVNHNTYWENVQSEVTMEDFFEF